MVLQSNEAQATMLNRAFAEASVCLPIKPASRQNVCELFNRALPPGCRLYLTQVRGSTQQFANATDAFLSQWRHIKDYYDAGTTTIYMINPAK